MVDVKISESDNIDSVRLQEQASDPSTPPTGYLNTYAKDDGGLYYINDVGTVVGPLGGSAGADIVQTITELSATASATDTTIDVKGLIGGALPETIWVVIDPFTVQCEIRKVTGISSLTLTIAALSYGHSTDDPVWFIIDPIANVKWFGAKGDGSTDDTAAIQAALNTMIAIGGGLIYLPNGTYVISSMLIVPDATTFIGSDMEKTILDIDTADNTGIEVGEKSILRDMTIYYTNTASAGSLNCSGVRNKSGWTTGVRLLKNLRVFATSTNIQIKVTGIGSLIMSYDANMIITVVENVEAYVTTECSAYGIDVYVNTTARVAYRNLTGVAICTENDSGNSATGIIINTGAGSPKQMLYDSYGYAEMTGALAWGCQGIAAWQCEVYNCYGYAKTAGVRNAVGIEVDGDYNMLFDCYGYGEADNNFNTNYTCGIDFSAGGYEFGKDSIMINCVGVGTNPDATGLGVGIASNSYQEAIIIGGYARGNDYDFLHDSGDDVYVYGLAYDTLFLGSTGNVVGNEIVNGNLTIGNGAAGVDYTLTFDGETGDVVITWMEDEDYLTTDKVFRGETSLYRRYYHMDLTGINPGASGATWTPSDGNTIGGWQLDLVTEVLYFGADVHSDWDGTTDLTVEVEFEINTASTLDDTVDLKLICYYKGEGEIVTKTQTVEVATNVGSGGVKAQYTSFKVTFTVDYDYASNVVEAGDILNFILNLETDTSEVDDIIITAASLYYATTHPAIESGDV